MPAGYTFSLVSVLKQSLLSMDYFMFIQGLYPDFYALLSPWEEVFKEEAIAFYEADIVIGRVKSHKPQPRGSTYTYQPFL